MYSGKRLMWVLAFTFLLMAAIYAIDNWRQQQSRLALQDEATLFDDARLNSPLEKAASQMIGDTSWLVIFPSPVLYTLNIVVPATEPAQIHLNLYSSAGELVKQLNIQTGRTISVNVSNLPAGSYVIRGVDDKGRLWFAKFIKA